MNEPPTSVHPTFSSLQPFLWLNSLIQPPLMFLFLTLSSWPRSVVWVSILISWLSRCRLLFHLLYRSINWISPDSYFGCCCGNSPRSRRLWPRSHADWPDVPSLIMNISILVSWITIVWSWYMTLQLILHQPQKPLYWVWGFVCTVLYKQSRPNQHIGVGVRKCNKRNTCWTCVWLVSLWSRPETQ